MSLLQKIIDAFFGRKKIVLVGTAQSGKTTLKEVMRTNQNIDPKDIERTRGLQNNIIKFENTRYRFYDSHGRKDAYNKHEFTEILKEADYIIYFLDGYKYLEAKLNNRFPKNEEYNNLTNNLSDINEYVEEVESWLNVLIQRASQNQKKMLIVASHFDLYESSCQNNSRKQFRDAIKKEFRNKLDENLSEDHSIDIVVADVTKLESAKFIMNTRTK